MNDVNGVNIVNDVDPRCGKRRLNLSCGVEVVTDIGPMDERAVHDIHAFTKSTVFTSEKGNP